MGQTDGADTYRFWDGQDTLWEWVHICPNCDDVLCSMEVADEFDTDVVIGCDNCGVDVTVEMCPLILIDQDGNRG